VPKLFKLTSEVNGVGIRNRAVFQTGWLTRRCLLSDLLYQRRFIAKRAGSDLRILTGTYSSIVIFHLKVTRARSLSITLQKWQKSDGRLEENALCNSLLTCSVNNKYYYAAPVMAYESRCHGDGNLP
jgi:hypothetical protein